MIVSANQVVGEIAAHIRDCGGAYSGWYVGIAAKPRDRLFTDHNVSEKNGSWIIRDAGSDAVARQIEQYFLDRGCKGGPGGGDWDSRFVYAYAITALTRE